jgi:hypothetical protein
MNRSYTVFKISNAQNTFYDANIAALQKGMYDLNTNLIGVTQLIKDKDKSGFLAFISDYLNYVQKTFGKSAENINGIADKNTIALFTYMRDQFLKVMAGVNLSSFIKEQWGNQSWFPQAEAFGESLKKIFEPVYASASSVKSDVPSMAAVGTTLGPALAEAGNQALALAKNYTTAVNKSKVASPSERVRLVVLKKEIEKLAKRI